MSFRCKVDARYQVVESRYFIICGFQEKFMAEIKNPETLKSWKELQDLYNDPEDVREKSSIKTFNKNFQSFLGRFKKFAKIQNGYIVGYRAISVNNIPKLLEDIKQNKNGLGIYWTYKKEMAEHWNKSSKQVIITALIPESAICYVETIAANISCAGENECELSLNIPSKVIVTNIKWHNGEQDLNSEVTIDFDNYRD
jgi:hypothetical protein